MIASLRGTVQAKETERVVLEVAGVGYEVSVTAATAEQLPNIGHPAFLHVVESFAMYGGGAAYYGFASPADKGMFLAFKDHVPSTGAKKALEYLDKASKSLPDFRRAILEKDGKILTGVFGFTKKTADKLIDALKDKLEGHPVPGHERFLKTDSPDLPSSALSQALSGLTALGYKPTEARAALAAVTEETSGKKLDAEQILRLALKRL
ncbi:MAG: Holliday junction branch migration protein RuvA [Elusimicrobia bacterium]|nr:Holliday junction branch migration protein RuvA [Elusimicrobiota bacterium]